MITINSKPKHIEDMQTQIPSGIQMTFENGNTISIQFGYGNYSSNRNESKPEANTVEIAMWNDDGKWYEFGNGDTVKGWVSMDEVADWIQFCKSTEF